VQSVIGKMISSWSPSAEKTTAQLNAHVTAAREGAERTIAARAIPVHYGNKG